MTGDANLAPGHERPKIVGIWYPGSRRESAIRQAKKRGKTEGHRATEGRATEGNRGNGEERKSVPSSLSGFFNVFQRHNPTNATVPPLNTNLSPLLSFSVSSVPFCSFLYCPPTPRAAA